MGRVSSRIRKRPPRYAEIRAVWHKRLLVNVLVAPCPFGQ
jgi:hypothetical protein